MSTSNWKSWSTRPWPCPPSVWGLRPQVQDQVRPEEALQRTLQAVAREEAKRIRLLKGGSRLVA